MINYVCVIDVWLIDVRETRNCELTTMAYSLSNYVRSQILILVDMHLNVDYTISTPIWLRKYLTD